MRIFNRRATIGFTHTFYDSSGDITSPTSASLTLSYPTSGFPFRGCLETTTVTLTQNTTTLAWEGSWSSVRASTGTIVWHIEADDLTLAVETGQFDLKSNHAGLSIASST